MQAPLSGTIVNTFSVPVSSRTMRTWLQSPQRNNCLPCSLMRLSTETRAPNPLLSMKSMP